MEDVSLTFVSDAMDADYMGASLQQICSAFITAVMTVIAAWAVLKGAYKAAGGTARALSSTFRWLRPRPNEASSLVLAALSDEHTVPFMVREDKYKGVTHVCLVLGNPDCRAEYSCSSRAVKVTTDGEDITAHLDKPGLARIERLLKDRNTRYEQLKDSQKEWDLKQKAKLVVGNLKKLQGN